MNKQFKNRIVGFETTPKFNEGMFCCVHMNTGPLALEDCSPKESVQEKIVQQVRIRKGNPIWLIQRQDEIIKALTREISDEEQELLEKDKQIAELENELEEICEKLFSEVNLSC